MAREETAFQAQEIGRTIDRKTGFTLILLSNPLGDKLKEESRQRNGVIPAFRRPGMYPFWDPQAGQPNGRRSTTITVPLTASELRYE